MTGNSVVTFESMFYERTNSWTQEGGLELSSGRYTASYPGTYSFTYSLHVGSHFKSDINIYLRLNGENIAESYHESGSYDGVGWYRDQGGRTLVTHLTRGDYVELYCQDCGAGHGGEGIWHVMFCVELSQFDIE